MGTPESKFHADNSSESSEDVSDLPDQRRDGGVAGQKRGRPATQHRRRPGTRNLDDRGSSLSRCKTIKGKKKRKKQGVEEETRHAGSRKEERNPSAAAAGGEGRGAAAAVPGSPQSARRGEAVVDTLCPGPGAEGRTHRGKGLRHKHSPSRAVTRSSKTKKGVKTGGEALAAAAAGTGSVGLGSVGLEYAAVVPFLRSEGWKCADGKGFHTWFYVFPPEAKGGTASRKRVDYLVTEEEVVKHVSGDEEVLSRYKAFGRRSGAAITTVGKSASTPAAATAAETDARLPTSGYFDAEAASRTTETNVEASAKKKPKQRPQHARGSSKKAPTHGDKKAGRKGSTTARSESTGAPCGNSVPAIVAPAARTQDGNVHDAAQPHFRAGEWRRVGRTAFSGSVAPKARPERSGSSTTAGRTEPQATPGAITARASPDTRHGNSKAGAGNLRVDSPAVTRGRSKRTGHRGASWRETWPKLRAEGWNWDYGSTLATSSVYLKPGVCKDLATVGVDMFDSKDSVLDYITKSPAGGLIPAADYKHAGSGAVNGTDSNTGVEGFGEVLPSTAWVARAVDVHRRRTVRRGASSSAGAAEIKHVHVASTESPRGGRSAAPRNKRTRIGGAVLSPVGAPQDGATSDQRRIMKKVDQKGYTGQERGYQGGTAADGGDEIELAAAAVMGMMRGDRGVSAIRRCVQPATTPTRFGGRGRARGADAPTVHCCEQLVALSKGSCGGGSVGSRATLWSRDVGENRRLCTKARSSGASADGGRRHSQTKARMSAASSSPNEKNRGGVESKNVGCRGVVCSDAPRSPSLVRPLSGVGVMFAGLVGSTRKEVEAGVRKLGGEVTEVLEHSAAGDGWRRWLLGEPAREDATSSEDAEGLTSFGGFSVGGVATGKDWSKIGGNGRRNAAGRPDGAETSRRMVAVASPGGERTPAFRLAVAAGVPIVHPSFIDACAGTATEVEPDEYLLPLGRSALGDRSVIMPSRSARQRPFQGKLVVLCMDELAYDETNLQTWRFIFGASGAIVKVVGGRSSGGGGRTEASQGGADGSRCTPEAAVRLLHQGRVHCVVGSGRTANGPVPPAWAVAVSVVKRAAVETGTLAGSLEWALQCMAHGRLLLPTAEVCPWFPIQESAAGLPGENAGLAAFDGVAGGRAMVFEERSGVGGSRSHVHQSGGKVYVVGDYVFLTKKGDRDACEGVPGAVPEAGGATVARIGSFRQGAAGRVKATVTMMDRGAESKVLSAPCVEEVEEEVDEDELGAQVLVLSAQEMEATKRYSLGDGEIFCLGD